MFYKKTLNSTAGWLDALFNLSGQLSICQKQSALAQPRMTFDEEELYPTVVDKAAALGYSLINNHPFVDGNKRIGHAAMEVFLILNGYEIEARMDEQEQIILEVAASQIKREGLKEWLRLHIVEWKQE